MVTRITCYSRNNMLFYGQGTKAPKGPIGPFGALVPGEGLRPLGADRPLRAVGPF